MNKFNTIQPFDENIEQNDINPFIETEEKNINKNLDSKILNTVKNTDNKKLNTRFLPHLELFSKHPKTTKKNNYLTTSFRKKYTSDRLKSIQISACDI